MKIAIMLAAALLSGPAQSQPLSTAAEIRPILAATKANWVALRSFDGHDLLYFTQLESWRCALSEISYAVNDGAAQVWQAEPCHVGTLQPNALTDATRLRYATLPAGAVARVVVTLTYTDGQTDSAEYARADLLMP